MNKHYSFFLLIPFLVSFVLCNKNTTTESKFILDCDSMKLLTLDSLADRIINNNNPPSIEKIEIDFFYSFPSTYKEFKCLYGYEGEYNGSTKSLRDGIGTKYAEKHIIQVFSNLKINPDTMLNKILNISIEAHWQPDAVNYLRHFLKEKITTMPNGYEFMLNFLSKHDVSEIANFWEFYYAYEEPVIVDASIQKYKSKYPVIVKIHDEIVLKNKSIKH